MTAFQFACLCMVLASLCVIGACISVLLGRLLRLGSDFFQSWLIAQTTQLLSDALPEVKPKEDRR